MRPTLRLLLLLALFVPVAPAAHAATCTSSTPVTDKHVAGYGCTGVHPGMTLRVHSAKYGDILCGASFAFTDAAKNRYLAFPGTCVLDFDCLLDDLLEPYPPPLDQPPFSTVLRSLPCVNPSDSELEPYYKKQTGPAVKDENGVRIGAVAYAVNKYPLNFALARLDPAVVVDPRLPLYGGPVSYGPLSASPSTGYVYAPRYSTVYPNAQAAVMTGATERVYASTVPLLGPAQGGSAIDENGRALGVMTGTYYVGEGYEIQPLGPALDHLLRRTGLKVTLMTAPLS